MTVDNIEVAGFADVRDVGEIVTGIGWVIGVVAIVTHGVDSFALFGCACAVAVDERGKGSETGGDLFGGLVDGTCIGH